MFTSEVGGTRRAIEEGRRGTHSARAGLTIVADMVSVCEGRHTSYRMDCRCHRPRFGQAQIQHESAESGTATVARTVYLLLLTQFPLGMNQVFQDDCY